MPEILRIENREALDASMATEGPQSDTKDEMSTIEQVDLEYQQAARILPSLVQLHASLPSISSTQYAETTKQTWEMLQRLAPEIGLPHDCDSSPSTKRPEWKYSLANTISLLADSDESDGRGMYKRLYSLSDRNLFGSRTGPHIAELNNAVDDESQAQDRENISLCTEPPHPINCSRCATHELSNSLAELYHELPGEGSFRILILKPGSMEEPIIVKLRCAVLAEEVSRFEALSYSWQETVSPSANIPATIVCNGVELSVQPTLSAALRRLRHKTGPRVMWIDALCINQSNVEERNSQVQMMGLIYKNAARTIVWLGETQAGCAKHAFGLICEIVNAWTGKDSAFFQRLGGRCATAKVVRSSGSNKRYRDRESLVAAADAWASVINLFGLSWWNRKWVLQEVTLSHSVLAMWQDCDISWYWIGLVAAIAASSHQLDYNSMLAAMLQEKAVSHAYLMLRLSRWGQLKPVNLSFLRLLRLTINFDTGEPRDSVFALLGLHTKDHDPGKRPLLLADYHLDIPDLNKVLAERILEAENGLDLLVNARCLRKHAEHQKNAQSWRQEPFATDVQGSWIPDWSRRLEPMLGPTTLDDSFTPAKGLAYKRMMPVDPLRLVVNGIKVATVLYSEATEDFFDHLFTASKIKSSGAFGHLSRDSITLFSRTFTMGKTTLGGPERQRDAQLADFAHWLLDYALHKCAYGDVDCIPSRCDRIHSWCREAGPSCEQCFSNISSASEGGAEYRFRYSSQGLASHRRLFVTSGGHLGIGPEQMASGDILCILGGANMPFIIRKNDRHFNLVGACFVDDIMDGEAVQSMKSGTTHRGLFGPELLLTRLYNFDAYPPQVQKVLQNMKREILEHTKKEYEVLKEEFIELG